jgi:murein DD-endopeptidase MepM/ murein hydrolase activator NlpD
MRRLILFSLIQLLIVHLSGQNNDSFHPPVNIPIFLSGNFGEIRSDHFHSGIDIKTQGTVGHPVFSVEKGYVSRIKVQANGYGNSIYITHPNGYTSVYGHLDGYRDDIAAYVKKVQYKRESFPVDLYLEPGVFQLDRGEFLAYSGNTGGSSGPHLHFEIRTASNQHPTNVLKYNFDIEDRRAPKFLSLFIYPLDQQGQVNGSRDKFSSSLVIDNGVYTIPWTTKVSASGKLGISVEVFDYLNGASNRCGVYSLEYYQDDQLVYRHLMDEFAFSETRYINAHIDYEERVRNGTKAHRLHRLPNDRLRIYDALENNGELLINEERNYKMRIVAKDVAGNQSELAFTVSGNLVQQSESQAPDPGVILKAKESNTFDQDPVTLFFPKNALYRDMEFNFESSPPSHGSLSKFYHIGNEEVPVHLPYTLSIKTELSNPEFRDKLLIVNLNDDNELSSAGGEFSNGKVTTSLRNFGKYAIGIDTIAPEIRPIGGEIMGDLTGSESIKFLISDELSDIHTYDGYIDNKWVLFEYDLKNDLLFYLIDKERIELNTEHELELYVTDSKGNTNLYQAKFTW